jgi:YD repeat-containing protein
MVNVISVFAKRSFLGIDIHCRRLVSSLGLKKSLVYSALIILLLLLLPGGRGYCPVNVQTGNFFLPVQDLYLPCYGFPLEVHRAYNSVSSEVGAFGMGWSFNYNLHISVASGDNLTVIEPDGFINLYVPVSVDKVDTEEIEAIVQAKRAEDTKYLGQAKQESIYDDLRSKLKSDAAFFKRQRGLYLVDKKPLLGKAGKFVSRSRGTTFIYRKPEGYERSTQDGQLEFYGLDGYLRGVRDRNGNEMTFRYDNVSRLSQVQDACGQNFKIQYDPLGRINTITDNLLRTLSYTYDAQQRLTSSRDLEGKIVRYEYDKKLIA